MNYFIVLDLTNPHASGATHVGVTQAPKIGGDWLFDLLTRVGPNEYNAIQGDCTAPSSPSVTSLSELTAAQAKIDIEAHLGTA